jgi:hypothetical protein
MTVKNFITTFIAVCSVSVTDVAICASPYISHGKLEDELPDIIIGSFSGIFLFLFVNWLFKPRSNNKGKVPKKRR